MQETILWLKKTARLAGFLYLLLAVLAFFGLMYGPSKIMVRNDAAATVANMFSHEWLFRVSIAAHLASTVIFLLLAVVLYQLFKGVHRQQARTLVVLMVVQAPIVFVLESFKLTALRTANGQLFETFSPAQTQDIILSLLKMYASGIALLELLWGLWLLPFAQLVYRSQFIPRILGFLLFLAGLGYAVDSLITIVFPNYHSITQKIAFTLSGLGEVSTIFWLLLKGVRVEFESSRVH